MQIKRTAMLTATTAIITLILASTALAGGLRLYEITATEISLASAGWAARAEDPSTLYTNPAGLIRLDGSQFQLHLHALYGDMAFSQNAETTVDGSNGGNAVGLLPGGSAFYSRKLSDRLVWGVGFVSNFGLALAYDDGWAGRYYAQEATLIGVTVVPSVAYRLSDTVSIGLGLEAMYGIFNLTTAVPNLDPRLADASLEFNSSTWGFAARLGVLVEPSPATRFGFTYNSQTSLDFADTPAFEGLGPLMEAALQQVGLLDTQLDMSMKAPQGVMASFYHETSDTWALMGNLGWENWSQFGKVGVVVATEDPTSLTVDRNYEDTWHAAIGARHKLEAPWTISFGVAYDSSMVEDANRTADLPMGEAYRFGVGGVRELKGGLELALAYELTWVGDLALDQYRGPLSGRVAGTYESAALHFFGVTLHWGADR